MSCPPQTSLLMHIQLTSLTSMFQILDEFWRIGHSDVQKLYRALIFLLIEHYSDMFIRHVITSNLAITLQTAPDIPVNVLLDKLIRQVWIFHAQLVQLFNFRAPDPTGTGSISRCRFVCCYIETWHFVAGICNIICPLAGKTDNSGGANLACYDRTFSYLDR